MPHERLDKWFYKIVPWYGFLEEAYRCLKTEIPRIEVSLALAYSMALMGHLLRGRISIGGASLRTNYYLLVVGDPATAKSVAWLKLEKNLLDNYIAEGKMVIAHTAASYEGLARAIAEYADVIHFADEVQRIFRHKKTGAYLGDIPDLWKIAWNCHRFTLFRRSKAKSITVPGDYMFTVIATTTPDDLEHVLEALGDPALLRRFLPVSTHTMTRYGEGEPANWEKLKMIVEFMREIAPVEFIIETPGLVPKLTDLAMETLGITPGSWMYALIDTYMIKTACILAFDRLVAYLIGNNVNINVSNVPQFPSSLNRYNILLIRLDHYINRIGGAVDGRLMAVEGVEESIERQSRRGGEGERVRSVESVVIEVVEGVLKKSFLSVEDMLKRDILSVEELLRRALASVEVPVQPPPRVLWGPNNRPIINVSVWDLARALFIVLGLVIQGFKFYEYLGMDAKWAYFLRRLRELSERYDVIDMRVMAQYMRKFGGYQELRDYVLKAVLAGILVPTTKLASSEDLYKAQFQIHLPVWSGEG